MSDRVLDDRGFTSHLVSAATFAHWVSIYTQGDEGTSEASILVGEEADRNRTHRHECNSRPKCEKVSRDVTRCYWREFTYGKASAKAS